MKLIKKYGLYICIATVVLALGMTSYITERKKLDEKTPVETSYMPEAVRIEKQETDEMMEKGEKPENSIVPSAEKINATATQSNIPLAFSSPVMAGVSVGYSGNEMVYSKTMGDYRTHNGIDYAADEGTDVMAVAYGTVADVSNDDYLGLTVTIDHGGGLVSVYSSLSESFVSVGNEVQRGDRIGAIGNSAAVEQAEGAHLHFEARKDGKVINPAELMN